jgi:23S rRNA (cytosine1962-C5)-methyltransferase
MVKIHLNKRISSRIANGHPWIYANEIGATDTKLEPGDLVSVYTHDRKFVGKGYANPLSQITVRLLTREKDEDINEEFFCKKINDAWKYRKKNGYEENCRLVFGEADYLPGLIIDKFNEYFVIQTLSAGIDRWKPAIAGALREIFSPRGIFERNDAPVRELEGLPQQKGFLSEPFETEIIINENGLQFYVDIRNGQKTGFFLDQHDHRRAIRHIVKDADVLGVFCYTGSFEIHAASYGAKKVTGLDISETALQLAGRNAALNKLDHLCRFQEANAFDELKSWAKQKKLYDVVMLDPPAFTKSRETIRQAVKGYKEINLRAIKLLRSGGFLVSSSCSNFIAPDLFLQIIDEAARDCKRKIRQVTFQSQGADHPIMHEIESTNYLKFLIVEVI